MIVTPDDVAALRDAVARHLVSSKWISNLHRAIAAHRVETDPQRIAQETFP